MNELKRSLEAQAQAMQDDIDRRIDIAIEVLKNAKEQKNLNSIVIQGSLQNLVTINADLAALENTNRIIGAMK